MRWPWQRARPADAVPAVQRAVDGPPAESRAGWAFLPPLQRTVGSPELTSRPLAFVADLTTRAHPLLTGPMSHVVSPAAPSGVLDGDGDRLTTPTSRSSDVDLTLVPAVPTPRPATVQRAAVGSLLRLDGPPPGLPGVRAVPVSAPALSAAESSSDDTPDVQRSTTPAPGPARPDGAYSDGSATFVPLPAPARPADPPSAAVAPAAGSRPAVQRRLGLGAPLPSSFAPERTVALPPGAGSDRTTAQPEGPHAPGTPAATDLPVAQRTPHDDGAAPSVPDEEMLTLRDAPSLPPVEPDATARTAGDPVASAWTVGGPDPAAPVLSSTPPVAARTPAVGAAQSRPALVQRATGRTTTSAPAPDRATAATGPSTSTTPEVAVQRLPDRGAADHSGATGASDRPPHVLRTGSPPATVPRADDPAVGGPPAAIPRATDAEGGGPPTAVQRSRDAQPSSLPPAVQRTHDVQPGALPPTVQRAHDTQPGALPPAVQRAHDTQPGGLPPTLQRNHDSQAGALPPTVQRAHDTQPGRLPVAARRPHGTEPGARPASVQRAHDTAPGSLPTAPQHAHDAEPAAAARPVHAPDPRDATPTVPRAPDPAGAPVQRAPGDSAAAHARPAAKRADALQRAHDPHLDAVLRQTGRVPAAAQRTGADERGASAPGPSQDAALAAAAATTVLQRAPLLSVPRGAALTTASRTPLTLGGAAPLHAVAVEPSLQRTLAQDRRALADARPADVLPVPRVQRPSTAPGGVDVLRPVQRDASTADHPAPEAPAAPPTPPPTVQTATEPPPPTAAAAGPADATSPFSAATAKDLDDLARRLTPPLLRRVRAQLLVDRERRGIRADL